MNGVAVALELPVRLLVRIAGAQIDDDGASLTLAHPSPEYPQYAGAHSPIHIREEVDGVLGRPHPELAGQRPDELLRLSHDHRHGIRIDSQDADADSELLELHLEAGKRREAVQELPREQRQLVPAARGDRMGEPHVAAADL